MNECYRYVSLSSCKLVESSSFLNGTFCCCDACKNVILKFKSSVDMFLIKTYWMDFYVWVAAFIVCTGVNSGKCCLDFKAYRCSLRGGLLGKHRMCEMKFLVPGLSSFFVSRFYVISRKSLKVAEDWKLEWCAKAGIDSNTVVVPLTVSGSSYGHPQSVEHPRSRSAQKNPSAGSGSCLFKKRGGGKLWTPFVSLHYLFVLWKNMGLSSNFIWSFLQLVIVLKKEVIKTNNVTEHEDTDKYRQLLVRTLHSCSVRFPDMAANVIPVVCECLIVCR